MVSKLKYGNTNTFLVRVNLKKLEPVICLGMYHSIEKLLGKIGVFLNKQIPICITVR